jgi:hypothetical protein
MQGTASQNVVDNVMARAEAAREAARERCRRSKLVVDRSNEILNRADERIRASSRRLASRPHPSPKPADYRAAALPPELAWKRNSTTSPSAIT